MNIGGALARRDSGILVPAHLAIEPQADPSAEAAPAKGARDPDGRRRIVLSKETRKLFLRLVRDLTPLDLALFMACRKTRQVPQIVKDAATGQNVGVVVTEQVPDACGEVMLREDEGGTDPGFGCKCTRIHFIDQRDAH